jgi:hypothetical protein
MPDAGVLNHTNDVIPRICEIGCRAVSLTDKWVQTHRWPPTAIQVAAASEDTSEWIGSTRRGCKIFALGTWVCLKSRALTSSITKGYAYHSTTVDRRTRLRAAHFPVRFHPANSPSTSISPSIQKAQHRSSPCRTCAETDINTRASNAALPKGIPTRSPSMIKLVVAMILVNAHQHVFR